jgi:hypothetical protein
MVFVIVFLLLLLVFPLSLQGAVKTEECLDCHDKQKGAVHGRLSCTDCHSDIKEVPHPEKLGRPSCAGCHEKTEKVHGLSVHGKRGLACSMCHNSAHFVKKERKECASCHVEIAHRTLPSKVKHLVAIPCLGCHGKVTASAAEVTIYPRREANLAREMVDLDGSRRIEQAEWDRLLSFMSKEGKGAFRVERKYTVAADAHSVAAKPVGCATCHVERRIFPVVHVNLQTQMPLQFPAESGIFVPELPSTSKYRNTVHGRRGVGCADCHVSQDRISDSVCASCHGEVHKVYKQTVHAQKGAAACIDCHNPHNIRSYRELGSLERVAVCARCHKDHLATHRWLPNTALHFRYLECSTCHSPRSVKSMVFSVGTGGAEGSSQLNYADLRDIFGGESEPARVVDMSGDGTVSSRELTDFFLALKRRFGENLNIRTSIIVTEAHHDYSVKSPMERVCRACHSEAAPFYDSIYLILPDRTGTVYVPVKGTVLSAAPLSLFTDMFVLGEMKITKGDLARLFRLSGKERSEYVRELGFKWIDLIGILLILFVLLFVILHIIARMVFRR